jgi:hypothetical protein
MIRRILKTMLEPGVMSKRKLAESVGLQPETLDDIIRLLVQRGYLEPEGDACETSKACSNCDSKAACEVMIEYESYRITERGIQYAKG